MAAPKHDGAVFVYMLTCVPSGRKYVGITTNVHQRWNNHVSAAHAGRSPNRLLQASIRKYGRDAFTVIVLYEAVCRLEAEIVEKGLIAAYGTLAPHGMNMTCGGEGTPGLSLPKSLETREKIGAAHRGRKLSEERRVAFSKINIGRKHSVETREKLSEIRTGRRNTPNTIQKMSESASKRWDRDRKRHGISPPRASGEVGIYWSRKQWLWHVEVQVGGEKYRRKFTDLAKAVEWRDETRLAMGWAGCKNKKPKEATPWLLN